MYAINPYRHHEVDLPYPADNAIYTAAALGRCGKCVLRLD